MNKASRPELLEKRNWFGLTAGTNWQINEMVDKNTARTLKSRKTTEVYYSVCGQPSGKRTLNLKMMIFWKPQV